MLAQIRKKRGNRVSLTVRMPINAPSRAAVDAEIERVRHCVIPIIGDDNGSPYLVGSAVALTYCGRKCLATALHVLNGGDAEPLFTFGADGLARPLRGTLAKSVPHDLAALALDPPGIEALSHIPFLEEQRLGSAAGPDGRFYASVAGYTHTASKRIDKLTLDTPMDVYSNRAREEQGGFVSVLFNKKHGAWSETGHVIARDPVGKSGGAIFGIPLLGLNAVRPDTPAKLVGIPTDWKRADQRIAGASVTMLVPLLEQIAQSERGA